MNGAEEWHHPAYTLDEKERALEPGARYFARLGQLLLGGETLYKAAETFTTLKEGF